MAKIGLFYATESGTTRKVAKMIQRRLDGGEVELHDVAKAGAAVAERYDTLIFGAPTLGIGELPKALETFMADLEAVDLTGKTITLFGLGNQEDYPDEFVDALGILYKRFKKRGVVPVGAWPADGYTFTHSKAFINGQFVGLVIDHDNQETLTEQRVAAWVERIKPELLALAAAA